MTAILSQINTKTATMAFTALLGLSVVTFAGHIQAATLHDAAHDVRHATGFPCH